MRLRGFSLPELMLALSLLAVFMLVGYQALRMADGVFRQVSGNEDAAMQLKRAVRYMQKDIVSSNVMRMTLTNVTAGLPGGAADGSALCLLTGADRGVGDMVSKEGGEPFWQRNILYYLSTPQGDPCQGGADANGFDDRCPHKCLVRKIIDDPPATAATDNPQNDEALITNLTPYLTRSLGRTNISNMLGEANVEQVELVARGLVGMRVQINADPNIPNEVRLTVTALNQPRGQKLALGTVALSGQGGLLVNELSIFPRNNR